ncbi:LysR family transcriptional regulator [Burkholderia sp. Bp8963]|uniref:LysR family transcriptional regulator n=1 Tax=Burkholderia sp. Bp8963 TaxID=2184547 RepID=UPI000F59DE06|nr:LysR family transcriptional regulator [Burkholderia sp. Bp8963]RQS66506.1 LysR family transcriptional regulator [Burkholderia sp. Bp8963]
MPINLTLHQIDAFRAVARYRSFSAAAKALFISQPSLTLLIRNLEEALAARLFDRTTRKVELTAAGEEFLPVSERIFAELELARENIANRSALRRGKVSLGALPSASAYVIPNSIYEFRQAYPEIAVNVKDGVAGELIDMVRAGEVDFAVGSYTSVEPDLQFRSVTRDEMYLVCRSDHRLAGRRKVKWSEILGEPFIAMSPGTSVRYATDTAFASLKAVKAPTYDVALLSTMFGLARAGVGVTALPMTVLEVFNVQDVSKIPLVEPVVRRDIGFVTRRGRDPSPAARKLMETIERRVANCHAAKAK